MTDIIPLYSAFLGSRLLASGPLPDVARAAADAQGEGSPILIFDDATGKETDLDLRGGPEAAAARYAPPDEARGRGRPKLGVIAREVTLLPRHWEWLAAQRGGASHALRRLIDAARQADGGVTTARQRQERCYRVLTALAGDLPSYEEATRALFAGDRAAFEGQTAAWPPDIQAYAARLAWPNEAL
ncbi:hypothetical protein GCM10011497_20400 [Elstera cyanobacteriorum]|uniref:DUF2239 domain-containing protein n=1 Tax=Elstera cyanobacteriorum TaxID=2022747 RepID=A0A255XQZ4_9PROT|nr:DUF2239 family protein [Elstera cyanobacteriorum]OYQ19322.1 hypothetical protein CHR90_07770 [Elstera cyanobacteriorum]GFZ90663.1 hypothetical protein GCM10011497_20400 [Elstera cyanobacteriorum]